MALINYKDIDFKQSINKENKIINFNGSEIQIVSYLSINDKYDLIMATLQKSFENGVYNPLKLDMYFNLNIVYLYTNILIDTEDRADEVALYDTLKNSGLIDLIISNIPTDELEELMNYILKLQKDVTKAHNTFARVFEGFIESFPQKIEKMVETLNELNPEKIQALINSIKPE